MNGSCTDTANPAVAIGTYDGLCNRTACRAAGAKWWNASTRKFYCVECASLINLACRRFNEDRLCEYRASATNSYTTETK